MNCEKCGAGVTGPVMCDKCKRVLRGKIIGRPRKYSIGGKSIAEIAATIEVSASTVRRFLDGKKIKNNAKKALLESAVLDSSP